MNSRTDKIASQILQICALALAQEQVSRKTIYTVLSVIVPPHMRSATVYLSKLGPESLTDDLEDLRTALQKAVAAQLTSKFTPKLRLKVIEEPAFS